MEKYVYNFGSLATFPKEVLVILPKGPIRTLSRPRLPSGNKVQATRVILTICTSHINKKGQIKLSNVLHLIQCIQNSLLKCKSIHLLRYILFSHSRSLESSV